MKRYEKHENKDRKRDKEGPKAQQQKARRAKQKRFAYESGHGRKNWR